MIRYNLVCDSGCEFEAWFRCSQAFDVQEAARLIECPHCGSDDIKKSVMAPKVKRAKPAKQQDCDVNPLSMDGAEGEIVDVLRRFRAEVEARSQYVGREFAAEVRDMHFDDKPKRNVWGEATQEDVRELMEDDIVVVRLPRLPEDSD